MEIRYLCDFDDLVIRAADALESTPGLRAQYRRRFPWVSVDEYQDIDEQQVRLVTQLVPPDGNICAIGDPDQAIYGFGARTAFLLRVPPGLPGGADRASDPQLPLRPEHRRSLVTGDRPCGQPPVTASRSSKMLTDLITIHEAPTERAEAEFIVRALEHTLGGHSFFSIDSDARHTPKGRDVSFSDFAVLYRTEAQVPAPRRGPAPLGLPFQQRSHRRLLDHPGVIALIDTLRDYPRARVRSGAARSGLPRG